METELMRVQKLAFLSDPENYPEPTGTVEMKSTHMSWVFLTDSYVYKMKKPFHYDHVKLITPEARHQNCLAEVELNRRLAPQVYLGVVALSLDKHGRMRFGEDLQTVDWLVKMKRLPADMMLGAWIVEGREVAPEALEKAAELLTNFYLTSKPVAVTSSAYLRKLRDSLEKYHNALRSPEFNLPEHAVDAIYEGQINILDAYHSAFENRALEGHVKDTHGDLKPDHICLSPTAIIDCLEFDRELRSMDVLDDLAFLAVECERLGVPWIGRFFIRHYQTKAGDHPPVELLAFYKSRKAYIRALLSIRHIREPQYRHDPKWRNRTDNYLSMAASYLQTENIT